MRCAATLVALLGLATPAWATEEKEEEEEEVRDELTGNILEWGRPRPKGVRAPDPPGWIRRLVQGINFETDDGSYRLNLGGRLLLDGALIHEDDGLVNKTIPGEFTVRGEVRQGRLLAQGRVLKQGLFKIEYEFAGDDPAFTDFWIGVEQLGPVGTLKLGHMKQPFSLEQLISRRFLTFMERSLANALAPRTRAFGIFNTRTALEERLQWGIGFFRDVEEFPQKFGKDDDYNLTLRVAGLPVFEEKGARMLEVGASYSHQFKNEKSASVSSRPESHLADELLDTGTIDGMKSVDRIGLETSWVRGRWSGQAEYLHAFFSRRSSRGGSLDFWGLYAQASCFLTGEHRVWGRKSARYGRVVPAKPFDPLDGGYGAWQAALRVSHLDLDDGNVRGGRETNLTLGLNWFPWAVTRFTLNYIYGHIHGQGNVHIGQGRFQIAF